MFRIVHAAITDLDGVAIEDFSKLVVSREVIVYYGKESVSHVGANIFAEWGVVPEYVVPLSVFSLGGRIWFVVKSVTVSAFVECFLVWRGGLVK